LPGSTIEKNPSGRSLSVNSGPMFCKVTVTFSAVVFYARNPAEMWRDRAQSVRLRNLSPPVPAAGLLAACRVRPGRNAHGLFMDISLCLR
jgi:hypothetical protein